MTEHNTSGGLTEGERHALFARPRELSVSRDTAILEGVVERILADRLAAVQAEWQEVTGDPTPEHARATSADILASMETLAVQRDSWKANAEQERKWCGEQQARAESAEAENARLRAQVAALADRIEHDRSGPWNAMHREALRAAAEIVRGER